MLKVKRPEAEASAESFRKGFPVNGLNCVVTPTEALVHILFDESEAVLTANSGGEVAGDCPSAYGQLHFGCW
jgi:hypothetical protein